MYLKLVTKTGQFREYRGRTADGRVIGAYCRDATHRDFDPDF